MSQIFLVLLQELKACYERQKTKHEEKSDGEYFVCFVTAIALCQPYRCFGENSFDFF